MTIIEVHTALCEAFPEHRWESDYIGTGLLGFVHTDDVNARVHVYVPVPGDRIVVTATLDTLRSYRQSAIGVSPWVSLIDAVHQCLEFVTS